MLKARYSKHTLHFHFLARTSREEMMQRDTYFIHLWDDCDPAVEGIGECNLFKGLSAEDSPEYESRLGILCRNIASPEAVEAVGDCSSIIFGLETALADLKEGGGRQPFPGLWTMGAKSIPINGLVWMGDRRQMESRIKEKLNGGYRCLKLKIGGISFDEELELLSIVRRSFCRSDLEIRLDANGAFMPDDALEKLKRLSDYAVHSIEQPIRAGQHEAMARLCEESPIPIALDEELIGVNDAHAKAKILDWIKPQYIILKPALCGGFAHSEEWIAEARRRGIGWWATSALESNVGLNALAQWVSKNLEEEDIEMRQGLGTGALYTNNISSPLTLVSDRLRYDPSRSWGMVP